MSDVIASTHLHLHQGSVLEVEKCGSWQPSCLALGLGGHVGLYSYSHEFNAEMNRYKASAEPHLVDAVGYPIRLRSSAHPLFLRLGGASIRLELNADIAKLKFLSVSKPTSDRLELNRCASLSAVSLSGQQVFDLRPLPTEVVIKTRDLRISAVEVKCNENVCSFVLSAAGSIKSIQQNEADIWP